jgi:hypothetical protein
MTRLGGLIMKPMHSKRAIIDSGIWIGSRIMNYSKVYKDFIISRRIIESKGIDGYFEKHHIVPKSLGGSNEDENMIKLSAADHLFAHKLLALIHGGQMWHALHMCNINDSAAKGIRLCRRWYEKVRKERSAVIKERMTGSGHHFYGKKLSREHVKKLVQAHKGQRTGKDNHMYDPNFYHFRNIDGRHEFSTKSEFRVKNGIKSCRVADICNGNRPTAHGWYVSEKELTADFLQKKGVHNRCVDNTKHKFRRDDGVAEFCSQYELRLKYPELSQSHISGVCRGVRPSHLGWRIEK